MLSLLRFLRPLVVLAWLGVLLGTAQAADAARPNVLFIAIDDLRDWVGFLGHNPQTKTPNLDRLARMGMTFTRSYCAAPVCNPSRTALMSGLRPFTTGVYDNGNDWRPVISEDKPLTSAFRKAGYYVCGSGKIYHEAYARPSEWDDYLKNEGGMPKVPAGQSDGVGGIKFAPLDCKDEDLNDWRITSYGIDQLGRKRDQPLFLAVGLHKPHMPWNVPKKYYDLFPLATIQLPPYLENDLDDLPPAALRMAHPATDHEPMLKSGRWKEAIQGYLAAIAYTDMNIGRLLDAFEKSAYKDNTIICLWSDHGWHLGEKHHWRKFTLWEEATRQPTIWVVPGVTKPGAVCDRTVDLMSVYPTLTDLCGIPTPSHVEGRSIRALLTNPQAPWDLPAMTTFRFGNHTVRTEDWRYIHYENGDEELYQEAKDPNEWTNLAAKPEYAAQLAKLRSLLPAKNHADIGGRRGQGAEEGEANTGVKGGKRKKAN
ncbi:MAG: iduronate-2-sulfatase [Opitutus sp.]|nr:iduronate-2-sulfatase [Opitutus sp.]